MLTSPSTRRPRSIEDLLSPQLAAALERLDVQTRKRFTGRLQGERRSKARGRSVEFEDYRPYVPGDDLRHIDWNVFARLERFFIKIFQEEQDLAVHILLDASASMDAGTPNKLITAQKLAMCLGYLALVNSNRFSCSIYHSRATLLDASSSQASLNILDALRGRHHIQTLARFLLDETFPSLPGFPAQSDSPPQRHSSQIPCKDFPTACNLLARTRTGKGVLLLISDALWPEGFDQPLNFLASSPGALGWDSTLIQILSPGEIDPATETDASGHRRLIGDLRLTDAETGRAAEVTVTADLLHRYRRNLQRFEQELDLACAKRSVNRIFIPSDADISALLLTDLRRRSLLG